MIHRPRPAGRPSSDFRHALALSAELLGAVAPDGRLEPFNPAWERALARPLEELAGEPFLALLHPEDRAAARAALEEARAGRHLTAVEARLRGPEGAWRRLRWSLAPGAAKGAVALAGRDVGEAAELRDAVASLQPLAQLGRLSLGLVHDVNNLLQMIRGCAEHLRPLFPADSPPGRDVQDIESASLVAGELAHSLAEAVRGAPPGPGVELNDAISRAARLLRRLLGGVRLRLELDPAAGGVALDRRQVFQILLNLAVNARDAMSGSGNLIVATSRAFDGRGGAVLSVSDTGPGMSPAVQARAFEPFFTTKPGKGTGLGLCAVRDIAASRGGSVAIRSRPGQGTTVLVRLPPASAS